MLELNEAAVSVALVEIRPVLRKYVGVYIDLQHDRFDMALIRVTRSFARDRHDSAAVIAGPVLDGTVKAIEDRG
jgi:hypothetical protein